MPTNEFSASAQLEESPEEIRDLLNTLTENIERRFDALTEKIERRFDKLGQRFDERARLLRGAAEDARSLNMSLSVSAALSSRTPFNAARGDRLQNYAFYDPNDGWSAGSPLPGSSHGIEHSWD